MKTYNWSGSLAEGLPLTQDEKLGKVVFLGEAGRGRRYEKVGFSRRNPPEVAANGRVMDAELQQITLPARDGKPEIKFWVLARSSEVTEKVIVRINTEGTYTKNTSGRWQAIAGEPEKVIEGWGAYGDAGRIGGWTDGLVIMKPGDVIKIVLSGGYKFEPRALWYDATGLQTATWKDYENIQALKAAEAAMADAPTATPSLNFLSDQLQAYTWSCGRVEEGIALANGATGMVVSLGQSGRGRSLLELPLVGFEAEGRLTQAAVVVLDEKTIPARYSWEQETIKRKYGLAQAPKTEAGFLVKISTSWVYTRGSSPEISVWQGTPSIFAEGRGAEGAAGGIYDWPEVVAILHEGDVLFIRPEGGYKTRSYALFVKGGKLMTEIWVTWKIADAKRDPAFYVARGTAPWGHVPQEWIGKVVTISELVNDRDRGDLLEERETGELISISPLVLNLGWDGQDRHDVEPYRGTWVKLTDKQVRKLEGAELDKRQAIRLQADALKAQAEAITGTSTFAVAESGLRERVSEIAREYSLDTLPTEGGWGSLTSWVEKAQKVLAEYAAAEEALRTMEGRKTRGEILVDFGGHFRRMGAAGHEDYWVIQPDGSLRSPDNIEYRKRYTSEGDKSWRLVEAVELALAWYGGIACEVKKLPVGGCTFEQLVAVKKIEVEDLGIPENSFGLDAAKSAEYAQKLATIKKACARSRVLRKVPELDFLTVTGVDGQYVEAEFVRGSIHNLANWAEEFNTPIANRSGQVVDAQSTEDGVVEFIVYEKYGTTNLNIRWRPVQKNEAADLPEADGPMADAMRKAGLI